MSRFCSKCNYETENVINFCPECGGAMIVNASPVSTEINTKKKYPILVVCFGLACIVLSIFPILNVISVVLGFGTVIAAFILSLCGFRVGACILAIVEGMLGAVIALGINLGYIPKVINITLIPTNTSTYIKTYDFDTTTTARKTYGFNEIFEFDDLEITIGDSYTFDKVNNEYSDHHRETVVKVPVTVKNISSETHGLNMFYYKVYGSQGTGIDTLDIYFKNNLTYMGDLRSGASKTAYLYFQYDGDGVYAIEFNNFTEKVTAEFTITK